MSDENKPVEPAVPEQPWTTTSTGYTQAPPPPPGYAPVPAGSGLSDSAAGAIAYITIIPAIIFLLIDPYKSKPFVKFHCIQELGLTLVGFLLHFLLIVPLLGLIIWVVGWVALVVVWLLCVLKASQGGAFKLPLIGNFAAEQSGWRI